MRISIATSGKDHLQAFVTIHDGGVDLVDLPMTLEEVREAILVLQRAQRSIEMSLSDYVRVWHFGNNVYHLASNHAFLSRSTPSLCGIDATIMGACPSGWEFDPMPQFNAYRLCERCIQKYQEENHVHETADADHPADR